MSLARLLFALVRLGLYLTPFACALAQPVLTPSPTAELKLARALRYHPEGTDFVIENGPEFFNRPLYCLNSPFRIDGGDRPEFSLYLPGRGGNLRFGFRTPAGVKWLHEAEVTTTRYRPGSLIYEIHDPLLGNTTVRLTALPMSAARGLVVQMDLRGATSPVELIAAFGGANGLKGNRGGDIGCEREPVSRFFQLHPDQCRDNTFSIASNSFVLNSKAGTIVGVLPPAATSAIADANHWEHLNELLASTNNPGRVPVLVACFPLAPNQAAFLAVGPFGADSVPQSSALPRLFAEAEARRRSIAERVRVDTPDPFLNAAAAALCVAADGLWDAREGLFMHGAVAWRTKFLGWRGPYSGDALGWHDRTRKHLSYYATRQNTDPVPVSVPPADPEVNLARNEAALHSNGDLSHSHYDMNLVAIDALFRHLLWTGDLELGQKMWPVLERHLAWEQRLFRRPFGPNQLPLYEAYACIWASDNMQYDGAGVAHATAYNYYHNKMAARLAGLLGKDPAPYLHEAELIANAMHRELWLPQRGWFAEARDYLGLQQTHPNPGLWTFYHTVDAELPNPFEAWQMTRFVDTQLMHLPIHGPGVPSGSFYTLPTTSWMPYAWSLNNVVMAEVAHTSLGFWQAGRPEAALPLFKGCLLDSMYLGLCPGNVGMCTWYDAARHESQRDFGDGIGATSRALVEGLFGVHPDALTGELLLRPGFPPDWDHASLQHPDLTFSFHRKGLTDTYTLESRFSKPMRLRLELEARRDSIASVIINGTEAPWQNIQESVGAPRIRTQSSPASRQEIVISWKGIKPVATVPPEAAPIGSRFRVEFAPANLRQITDPEKVLENPVLGADSLLASAAGTPGHHTIFAQLQQGAIRWWAPISLEILPPTKAAPGPLTDWKLNPVLPSTNWSMVDLSGLFNQNVTRIFQEAYLSPRSPFCSLQTPRQGLGGWCDYATDCKIDDSGLRKLAAGHDGCFLLPQGIPFQTPTAPGAKNVAFTSQWDNYPRSLSVPLHGKASHAYLLMAGSSNPMQSRMDNGEIIVTYADGTTSRLALENPTTWWPIDQDYFINDLAFRLPGPLPLRVDLKTGGVRLLDPAHMEFKAGKVPGGSATVLDLPLNPNRELKSLTVRALANEVIIGLMSLTLDTNLHK